MSSMRGIGNLSVTVTAFNGLLSIQNLYVLSGFLFNTSCEDHGLFESLIIPYFFIFSTSNSMILSCCLGLIKGI